MVADDRPGAVIANHGSAIVRHGIGSDNRAAAGVAAIRGAMIADGRATWSPVGRRPMITDNRSAAGANGGCAMVANDHSAAGARSAMVPDDHVSRIWIDGFRCPLPLPMVFHPHEAIAGGRRDWRRINGNSPVAAARINRNGLFRWLVLVVVVMLEIRDEPGNTAPASEVIPVLLLVEAA